MLPQFRAITDLPTQGHGDALEERKMKPLSAQAAMARIYAAGLTLADAIHMTDAELLRRPTIGRRTLAYIRNMKPIWG